MDGEKIEIFCVISLEHLGIELDGDDEEMSHYGKPFAVQVAPYKSLATSLCKQMTVLNQFILGWV